MDTYCFFQLQFLVCSFILFTWIGKVEKKWKTTEQKYCLHLLFLFYKRICSAKSNWYRYVPYSLHVILIKILFVLNISNFKNLSQTNIWKAPLCPFFSFTGINSSTFNTVKVKHVYLSNISNLSNYKFNNNVERAFNYCTDYKLGVSVFTLKKHSWVR